ncbi:uncharacterized protein METZ01_LOCUS508065, partial [marine metagenome]
KTVGSMVYTGQDGGSSSSALDFDGQNDYIEIPDDESLDLTSGYTIEMWIKLEQTNSHYHLMGKRPGCSNSNYQLHTNGGNSATSFGLHSTVNTTNGGTIYWDEWTHLAASASIAENFIKLYVNGSLVNSSSFSGSLPNNSAPVIIGESGCFNGYANGQIDEVRIWNRALSAAEVQEKTNKALAVNEETGLAGYWRFDEAGGTIVHDISGNGNDGVIYGATWTDEAPSLAYP